MSSYRDTLRFLFDLQLFGMKAGLENISRLVETIGHPELRFPSVHVAGTNGKGSTSSMIAAILTAAGYRTGLYTSPHLVDFSERIRVDGRPIPEREIVRYAAFLRPAIRATGATFFEATTAMAFQYFADREVDVAVIETGLGGRLDATNIITPMLSLITTIGLDHTEHLGRTIRAIAAEKGGIIKPFTPCLAGRMPAEALRTLSRIARDRNAELLLADLLTSGAHREEGADRSVVDLRAGGWSFRNLLLSLPGEHQLRNAQLALLALHELKRREGFSRIGRVPITRGLAAVGRLSGLRGRAELLAREPLTIADVAHNPDGIRAFVRAVRRLSPGRKGVVLFGVLSDKARGEMIAALAPIARKVIAVAPRTARAVPLERLLRELHDASVPALGAPSVAAGVRLARASARPGEAIFITGSHYVVGEAMAAATGDRGTT